MGEQRIWTRTILIMIVLILLYIPSPLCQGSLAKEELDTRSDKIFIVNASSGRDYTHIQWAIDNATDGDTVYVEKGIYKENLKIDKRISLFGESRDRTTIKGEGRIVNISANGVNVSGFLITGSTVAYEGIGIYLENVDHCNISGNNCSNNSYCGIALNNTSHTVVLNNISL